MSTNYDDISEVLQEIQVDNPGSAVLVSEALNRVNTMLNIEDKGWQEMFSGAVSGDDIPGPDLDMVRSISEMSREMSYGSPLISRGQDLRTSYVWSKGISIVGAPDPADVGKPKRGPKGKKDRFFADTNINRYILSAEAHNDQEAAAYNDGHFMFLGDDLKLTGHPIPFAEIDAVLLNPEFSGEVFAYRRNYSVWNRNTKRSESKTVWYYVDTFTGDRLHPEPEAAEKGVSVDTTKTLFVKAFNTMVGWPIGVPDSLPALKPARTYAEMLNDGRVVSKANAKFAYKVKNKTAQGAQGAAAKMSNAPGVGNAAAMGADQDLIAIPQANRTYDFNGLRPLAAQVATAINVSVVHILSDPGAAGSSYGSAANLDLPTKRAMVNRQNQWIDFFQRVLKWGTGEDLIVSFPSLDDPDPYREMQLVTMGWNSGTVKVSEMRGRTLEIGGFTPDGDAPEGVLLPNNEKSLARRDIDADGAGGSTGTSVASTASSPDQGKTNGSGGVSDSVAKDLRNEKMAEQVEQLTEQMRLLAAFLEDRQ